MAQPAVFLSSGLAIFYRHAELVSASILPPEQPVREEKWILKQVQDDHFGKDTRGPLDA
jgi:hypothetical protein